MVRSKSDGRWLRRCFQCWIASIFPLLFLASTPFLEESKDVHPDPHLGTLATVLGPLLGIISTSLAGVIASLLGCSTWRVATLQLSVQTIILFYAHGLLEFGAFAPTAPIPVDTSKEVVAGAVAAQLPQKFLDKRPRATMSVVLPCLNEPYAYKTVMKFCDRTPPEVRLGKLPNDFFAVATFDQHVWRFVIFRLGFMSCCWEHWTNCEDYGFTMFYMFYIIIPILCCDYLHSFCLCAFRAL